MKDKFDELLKDALKPEIQPDKELNENILKGKRSVEMKPRRFISSVAAAAIVLLILCPIGVYAANRAFHKTNVKEKSISRGNPDYVPDEIATYDDAVKEESIIREEGNADTKWTRKETVKLSNSVTNIRYYYDSYKAGIEDTGFDNWFTEDYPLAYDAAHIVVDMGPGYVLEHDLQAGFVVNGKNFSVYQEKKTENSIDDVSFIIPMKNTGNVRTYVNPDGYEYELVDEKTDEGQIRTYVMIYNDEYMGYIIFTDMSDEEIHGILNNTKVNS
ncbi:MAG: hypothetical protein J6M24_02135 [Lachnospiraceae bacterium]|nr:hypothetical protein [Lachnospiraceae bacterium]